jgi:hypothetical protein
VRHQIARDLLEPKSRKKPFGCCRQQEHIVDPVSLGHLQGGIGQRVSQTLSVKDRVDRHRPQQRSVWIQFKPGYADDPSALSGDQHCWHMVGYAFEREPVFLQQSEHRGQVLAAGAFDHDLASILNVAEHSTHPHCGSRGHEAPQRPSDTAFDPG